MSKSIELLEERLWFINQSLKTVRTEEMKLEYLFEKEDIENTIRKISVLNEEFFKDLMHRCWLEAKKFYTGKSDVYFFDYYEKIKNGIHIPK